MRAVGVFVRDLKGDGNAWLVSYHHGTRTTQKIGPDWEEAERVAEEVRRAQLREDAGLPVPLPLRAVLEHYRDGYVATLKHSTYLLQRGQIDNHLVPELGKLDARDLRESHVYDYIEKKLRKLSPSFVRGSVNVLKKCLRRLRREHPDVPQLDLEIAEIFDRAETSQAEETREISAWTTDEAAAILGIAHAKERRWYVMILLLLHTGCRRGEILGLKWPDVDFKNKRISIRRARVHGRTVTPKMRKKRDRPRTVAMTPAMEMSLLGLHTFRHRGSKSWVFQTRTGRPVDGTTVQRVWDRMRRHMAEEGIPTYTLHSLRHTFATLSLLGGKSIMWVSRQLGHKSVKVTLDVYGHVLPGEEVDLSYLPNLGAVTRPHQGRTRRLTVVQRDDVSS